MKGADVAMNAYANKNGVKLFALVAVLAMVLAGAAVMMNDDGVDAAWQMGGDIPTGDQTVAAGVDAVAISDFTITNNAKWTVKDGASFVINEGVTVTIEKGATLNIENGAYVEVNGTLEIKEGSTLNNASTNTGSDSGFYVNGSLVIDKGKITSNVTAPTYQAPSDLTDVELTLATSADTITGEVYSTLKQDSSANGVIKISGTVEKHLNGAGTLGYWVGVTVSGIDDGTYSLDWSGTAKSTTVSGGSETFYVQAGGYYVITMTNDDETYKFVIDTTAVNSGDDAVGEIYVNGTMTVNSNNKVPASIADQIIYVADGATADLNSTFDNVTITANAGSTRNPYTTGSVVLTSSTEASDLVFKTVSERVSAYVVDRLDADNNTVNTRATNYILDISGDLASGANMQLNVIQGNAGAYKSLYYLNDDGDDSNGFLMYGTVSVSGTLNIDGKLTGPTNSIMDVSGTLNFDGSKEAKATIFYHGQMNISGTVAIDSIDSTDGTVISGESDTSTWFDGAIIIIEGNGTMTVADADETFLANANVSGASYSDDDKLTLTTLTAALSGATAASESEIYVYGFVRTSGSYQWEHYYTVSENVTIPNGMDLYVDGYLLIAEGATLTIEEGADASLATGQSGLIIVKGTLMDYEILGFDYASAAASDELKVDAEVKSSDAEGTYDMYTSLKNALAGTPGTIELFGEVNIEGTVTIPEGFIVDQNGNSINILNDATLVVNGVIVSDDAAIDLADAVKDGEGKVTDKAGVLTVNNMIVNPNITYPASDAVIVPGFTANGTIGDYEDAEFLLAPAVAAANAGTLYDITSQGKISYSGELTFTAGEDNNGDIITINGAETSISKIIVSGFGVDISEEFTGTVQSTVTAGDSAVAFNKAVGYQIRFNEDVSGDADVITMTIAADESATGGITIASGSVTLSGKATFGSSETDILTIAQGATFVLNDGSNLELENQDDDKKDKYAALTVDGTLSIEEDATFGYTETAGIDTIVQINGTANIAQDITVDGFVNVDGTFAVAEDVTVEVAGIMYVNGTTVGAIDFATNADYIIAYPGASVDASNLQLGTDGESDAYSMVAYINGEPYLTVYGLNNMDVNTFLSGDVFEVKGYESVSGKTWYTDPEYQNEVKSGAIVEDTPAVYVKLKPLNADIQVSIGTGMSVYIDGIKMSNGFYDGDGGYSMTAVGTHTIEVTINPGYKGEATITFNGVTIANGGTFTITPEMTGDNADTIVLSVTGNITQDSTVVVDGGNDDSGMGLTDYLLIILVVLIVIMAIMVAMRLMRS